MKWALKSGEGGGSQLRLDSIHAAELSSHADIEKKTNSDVASQQKIRWRLCSTTSLMVSINYCDPPAFIRPPHALCV
jgi:hypothetical protein